MIFKIKKESWYFNLAETLTNKNIIFELKRIFSGFGKVATRSGYCELKLSKPQSLIIKFYDNELTFSSVDIEVKNTLSEFKSVRFSLPEFVSVLDLLGKNELFDLSYTKDQNVFWLNGLPMFNTKVLEDNSIFVPDTSVKYNQEDWSNAVDIISKSKKELKKGFSRETEYLLIDVRKGNIITLNNFDNKKVGELPKFSSGDNILLDKINAKVLETIFPEKTNLQISFNKNTIFFETECFSLKMKKQENLNTKLYYPI